MQMTISCARLLIANPKTGKQSSTINSDKLIEAVTLVMHVFFINNNVTDADSDT